jgi:hypothetical protein
MVYLLKMVIFNSYVITRGHIINAESVSFSPRFRDGEREGHTQQRLSSLTSMMDPTFPIHPIHPPAAQPWPY